MKTTIQNCYNEKGVIGILEPLSEIVINSCFNFKLSKKEIERVINGYTEDFKRLLKEELTKQTPNTNND